MLICKISTIFERFFCHELPQSNNRHNSTSLPQHCQHQLRSRSEQLSSSTPVIGVGRFPCEGQTAQDLFPNSSRLPGEVLSCKNSDVFGLQVGSKCKNIHKFFSNYQTDKCSSAARCSAEQGGGNTQTCRRDDIGVMGPIITPAFTHTCGGSSCTIKCSSYSRQRKV